MHKDLIGLITGMMPKLSKGQKQIARYIVEHYDKAAFMTAARLGQAVGVSESTVVRFASELGYEGYPQPVSYTHLDVYKRQAVPQATS